MTKLSNEARVMRGSVGKAKFMRMLGDEITLDGGESVARGLEELGLPKDALSSDALSALEDMKISSLRYGGSVYEAEDSALSEVAKAFEDLL